VRDVAQINYDPAGSRSDLKARFRDQIANLPLKHREFSASVRDDRSLALLGSLSRR